MTREDELPLEGISLEGDSISMYWFRETTINHRIGENVQTKLNRITEIAKSDKKARFDNVMHLINEANLTDCYFMLKTGRATGIDGIDLEEYEKNLGKSLKELTEKMKKFSYHPQPVRRVYIPKANGKLRPLGIPCTEDKIVQMGMKRILEAVYETDFLDCSYGFRPDRNCHQALDKLDKIIMTNPVNYIIDADIKGFFDNVNHDWLRKFVEHRISDKSFNRYIVRFLRAGIMEEGKLKETDKGTPQGGILSPILANIYLHYVLDLWVCKVVRKHCKGYVEMVRYADDFVICVENKEEANKILNVLKKRLNKFGLELAEDKTRIIEFGKNADKGDGQKPETFNFLGFTHFCDKGRKGYFKVGRKTDKNKFNAKLIEMNSWLRTIRNMIKLSDIWKVFCAKLRGHFQYYGVSGNYKGIYRFYKQSMRMLWKWLNRRSQKKSFNLKDFWIFINRLNAPKPKICHNFYTLYGY